MWVEAILFLLLLFLLRFALVRNRNFPPGPMEIPFFGNTMVNYESHGVEMQQKYGDIFMTKLGAMRHVFLADFKQIKETFSRIEFADRPQFERIRGTEIERKQRKADGIIFSNGPEWQNTRRFLLRHLRDLGMGKSIQEDAVLIEAENLVKEFKLLPMEPCCLPFSINIAVLNVIWQLVASHRYDYHDEKVQNFMELVNDMRKSFGKLILFDIFPVMKILPTFLLNLIGSNDFMKVNRKFLNIVRPFMDDHRKNLESSNPKDVMDDYLIELDEKENEEFSHFSENGLFKCILELFVAGNDTTSHMIHWILLYLAKFNDIQKEVQCDIDNVVSRDSLPRLEHRSKLPLIDAIIDEVSRHCSFTSFGVFRCASRDTQINGFFIPKHTVITSVAVLCHKDPKYWKNPQDFDPKRFINENGKFAPQTEGFLPFGTGRRQCIGEPLARMELYLFVAALLQNFTFEPPTGEEIDISPIQIPQMNLPNKKQKFLIKPRP